MAEEDAMSVATHNSSLVDGEEEMKDKSIDQLKEEQLSVQRQLLALKGLEDKRSVKAKAHLQSAAKEIQHQITLRKPVDERVTIWRELLAGTTRIWRALLQKGIL
eukprot:4571677-Karenia_brevis.AAC.1